MELALGIRRECFSDLLGLKEVLLKRDKCEIQTGFVLDEDLSRRIALAPYCRSFPLEQLGFLLTLMNIFLQVLSPYVCSFPSKSCCIWGLHLFVHKGKEKIYLPKIEQES